MLEEDIRGMELTVGKKVAYNRSGEVDIGTIIEIKMRKNTSYWNKHISKVPTYIVQSSTHPDWKPSKVMYKANLVVINE